MREHMGVEGTHRCGGNTRVWREHMGVEGGHEGEELWLLDLWLLGL